MENDYVLNRIFAHVPLREWILLETVCDTWQRVLLRCWRSITTLCIANDLFENNENYPHKLEEKDENEICIVLKRCGVYLNGLYLPPVNVRKPFFRNVRRFTARHELSESVLSAICEYCVKLKTLDLSYHIFSNWSTFELLQKLPPSVERVLMEICRLDECPPSGNTMTDLMNRFFDRLPNLKIFSLWGSCYGIWTVTDDDFRRMPASITYLDLSQGFTAKIGHLRSWLPPLINLKQLHLERTAITDDDLLALTRTCVSLRGLTLAYAKSITDFSPIASFRQLRYLRLDGNRDFFTDQALDVICVSCVELRSLWLENCNRLSSWSLRKITNLRLLQHLSLCSILSLDDGCLAGICACCHRLRSLQLKYCRNLTKCGLVQMPNLNKLRYLGISGVAAFDEFIANCMRMKCSKLRTIEAFNCENYR